MPLKISREFLGWWTNPKCLLRVVGGQVDALFGIIYHISYDVIVWAMHNLL
jgi:hypothetical protein